MAIGHAQKHLPEECARTCLRQATVVDHLAEELTLQTTANRACSAKPLGEGDDEEEHEYEDEEFGRGGLRTPWRISMTMMSRFFPSRAPGGTAFSTSFSSTMFSVRRTERSGLKLSKQQQMQHAG